MFGQRADLLGRCAARRLAIRRVRAERRRRREGRRRGGRPVDVVSDGRGAAIRLDVVEEVLGVADQGAEHVAGSVNEDVTGGVGAGFYWWEYACVLWLDNSVKYGRTMRFTQSQHKFNSMLLKKSGTFT